jgi:hypothetical protein
MLRQEMAAPGRIWLLLRHLDEAGRGWLGLNAVRQKLTDPDSETRVCGRRQLRNLLRQGRGVFWEYDRPSGGRPSKKGDDEERLWLRSAAKAAAALGVKRLTGRPVALPVSILLAGIGAVRAHFYASFHSGRRSDNPVSRSTLEAITQVPERTQRIYDQKAGVEGRRNIAVGERDSAENRQERAWRHGRAVFTFTDRQGRQGNAGQRYIAWRLPNRYAGPHKTSPKGRQKKINRQIDLVTKGAQGNGLAQRRRRCRPQVDRLFHPNGREAGKAYNRDPGKDAYWSSPGSSTGQSKSDQVWQVIPAGRR